MAKAIDVLPATIRAIIPQRAFEAVGCKPNRTNNNPMRLDMRRPKRSAVNVMAEREADKIKLAEYQATAPVRKFNLSDG